MQHLQLICRSHPAYKQPLDAHESSAGKSAERLGHQTPESRMRLSVPTRAPSVARYTQCMQINMTAALKRKRKIVKSRPYAGTRLAKLIETRVLELRPRKSQIEIATEAGYVNPNMLAMIKNGSTKLPLDRVPSVAKALECDPRLLFKLALEQPGGATTAVAIEAIFGTIVTRNEVAWLEEIRDASGHSDPNLTVRSRIALRAVFGK
jgi:hypothetical protein